MQICHSGVPITQCMLSETRQTCTFSILQSHESLQYIVSGWDRNCVTTVSTYIPAMNDFNMTALMHAAQTVWAHKEHNTAAVMNFMPIVPREIRQQRHSILCLPIPCCLTLWGHAVQTHTKCMILQNACNNSSDKRAVLSHIHHVLYFIWRTP